MSSSIHFPREESTVLSLSILPRIPILNEGRARRFGGHEKLQRKLNVLNIRGKLEREREKETEERIKMSLLSSQIEFWKCAVSGRLS